MDGIITFEIALSAFVIAMFFIMTWLYPTEEAATDALSKRDRLQNYDDTVACRGVPEYIDVTYDIPKTTDDLPIEDDYEW